MSNKNEMSYDNLKTLLAKENFPLLFTFKFIGKNSPQFLEGAKDLKSKCAGLELKGERLSQNRNHASFTYELQADTPELILTVYQAISEIPDLLIVL